MVALGVGGGGSGCHDKEAIMGKKELGKENNIFLFKVLHCSLLTGLLLKAGGKGFPTGTVILLQTVMVSTGTHLVKNHESQSRTSESQLKKTTSPKLKMLGTFRIQTVNLNTDSQTLYYSALKLKIKNIVLLF